MKKREEKLNNTKRLGDKSFNRQSRVSAARPTKRNFSPLFGRGGGDVVSGNKVSVNFFSSLDFSFAAKAMIY
jgi:hypothetical protein